MSFVGTRPEATKYVEKYTKEMRATLLLPAGITSEASIRYKDEAKLLRGTENIDDIYVKKILPKKMKYVSIFYMLDYEKTLNALKNRFGKEWIMLIRTHYYLQSEKIESSRVKNVSDYPDMQQNIFISSADTAYSIHYKP